MIVRYKDNNNKFHSCRIVGGNHQMIRLRTRYVIKILIMELNYKVMIDSPYIKQIVDEFKNELKG